ncbi:hypothetical protein ABI59_00310 [Acidobacteria bacterium Mor1]|nr:hypothetical protein ABI59_00310 [Acidobacteria bacterium Mor1]
MNRARTLVLAAVCCLLAPTAGAGGDAGGRAAQGECASYAQEFMTVIEDGLKFGWLDAEWPDEATRKDKAFIEVEELHSLPAILSGTPLLLEAEPYLDRMRRYWAMPRRLLRCSPEFVGLAGSAEQERVRQLGADVMHQLVWERFDEVFGRRQPPFLGKLEAALKQVADAEPVEAIAARWRESLAGLESRREAASAEGAAPEGARTPGRGVRRGERK